MGPVAKRNLARTKDMAPRSRAAATTPASGWHAPSGLTKSASQARFPSRYFSGGMFLRELQILNRTYSPPVVTPCPGLSDLELGGWNQLLEVDKGSGRILRGRELADTPFRRVRTDADLPCISLSRFKRLRPYATRSTTGIARCLVLGVQDSCQSPPVRFGTRNL